ncbi:MAG: GH116 family glycosyl hydrolase [Vicinamibacterales bacterium]
MSSRTLRRGVLTAVIAGLLTSAGIGLDAGVQSSARAAPAVVPRFAREANPIALRGPARPERYMEASGRKAALLGREDGSFEAWVYPLKVLHDFRLSFGTPDYADPIPGVNLAASVDVRPEASTVRYAHAAFTIDAVWLVPLGDQGAIVLLDVSTSQPLQVVVKFRPDLKPMWPAALGGQYSYWDAGQKAYVLGEASGKHAAVVGSPFAIDPPEQPAHNLPDAPSQFTIAITPETAARGLVPIVISASLEGLAGAKAAYEKLLASSGAMYRESAAHYRRLREEMTSIDSPDDRLDLAFEWGKVALDKGFVCNPHLGCGLIAGLGPSGTSERPGFGWFFGGDAFINSWAMTAYGDFATVKRTLEFLRVRQRADGKMMHELSQGAGYIKWFEEFPYGYYHADTTPLYIVAVRDYVRASGDTAMAQDFWPSMRKAYEYCASTDEDGDGLMDNTKAGLAAVETGALRRRDVLTDVYLGAAWTEAADAAAELADLVGDSFAATAKAAAAKARASLNARFLDDEGGRIYFAYMNDGKGQAEPTVWPGFGLWRGVFDASRPAVAGALDDLAGAGVGADWGARMLSIESALYQPLSYNNGASWPFLTGFAALALYANGRPDAAWTYLDGTADLTFLESRGYMAELFSGDRLRSIDAAVPHQLFATTGFVSTLMRGLVGLNALPAGTLDGRAVPARLQLVPQLPAGWGWLKVRNLRWQGMTADVSIVRNGGGVSVEISPRGGTLPVELHAILPPGARQLTRDLLWRPVTPGASLSRGLRLRRFESVAAPSVFALRATPGVRAVPLHAPLELGDMSSRLRVIDATMDGSTYTLRVEGRRGRSYQVRLLGPPAVSVEGAARMAPAASAAGGPEGEILRIDMPPADPASAGAVLRRTDWARVTVTVRYAERRQ